LALIHAGKGVDRTNELQPDKLPRGYGGVGILWHTYIDSSVNSLIKSKI
jgi:hypothetical protein